MTRVGKKLRVLIGADDLTGALDAVVGLAREDWVLHVARGLDAVSAALADGPDLLAVSRPLLGMTPTAYENTPAIVGDVHR